MTFNAQSVRGLMNAGRQYEDLCLAVAMAVKKATQTGATQADIRLPGPAQLQSESNVLPAWLIDQRLTSSARANKAFPEAHVQAMALALKLGYQVKAKVLPSLGLPSGSGVCNEWTIDWGRPRGAYYDAPSQGSVPLMSAERAAEMSAAALEVDELVQSLSQQVTQAAYRGQVSCVQQLSGPSAAHAVVLVQKFRDMGFAVKFDRSTLRLELNWSEQMDQIPQQDMNYRPPNAERRSDGGFLLR